MIIKDYRGKGVNSGWIIAWLGLFSVADMGESVLQIQSQRLTIRPPAQNDADAIVGFLTKNRSHLRPFEPIRPANFETREFWHQRIRELEDRAFLDRSYSFLIWTREHETLIGRVTFNDVVRGAFQACHLGYMLDQDSQGQGFMHEALSACLPFMFTEKNFHRIMANYMPSNHKSEKVLQRLGFVREGVAKNYLRIAGKWEDHVLTSLTNPNWQSPDT